MFNARRNNVSSSSDVGNTLNSTGRVMYIETRRTITEMVMFALMRKSSRNDGSGAIIAMTIPSTAMGTLSSAQLFPARDVGVTGPAPFFARVRAAAFAARLRGSGEPPPSASAGTETGAIFGAGTMSAGLVHLTNHQRPTTHGIIPSAKPSSARRQPSLNPVKGEHRMAEEFRSATIDKWRPPPNRNTIHPGSSG
jgi:hypothetical protein